MCREGKGGKNGWEWKSREENGMDGMNKKRREGKGREGKAREGKGTEHGREGKLEKRRKKREFKGGDRYWKKGFSRFKCEYQSCI